MRTVPYYVNTELRDWKTESGPRRAAVSSFGFSGTNAHLVLEEYQAAWQGDKVAAPRGYAARTSAHCAIGQE
ncbi:hypothetical protein KFU94_61490 [Chloroflexi bacterium TSY]|nr:hypothetical protein [Chloroflexi bacterium TSY]